MEYVHGGVIMCIYDKPCDAYDGYDDYQKHISYDLIDDTEVEYDPEEDVPEWERV